MKLRLGRPTKVRLESWMNEALSAEAARMAAEAGRPVSAAAILREVVARGLRMTAPEAVWANAYREGHRAAVISVRRLLHDLTRRMSDLDPEAGSDVGADGNGASNKELPW